MAWHGDCACSVHMHHLMHFAHIRFCFEHHNSRTRCMLAAPSTSARLQPLCSHVYARMSWQLCIMHSVLGLPFKQHAGSAWLRGSLFHELGQGTFQLLSHTLSESLSAVSRTTTNVCCASATLKQWAHDMDEHAYASSS